MHAAISDPDAEIVAKLAEHEQKELVRCVVVGSVDDGKSTLIGRLLFEGNGVYEDQIAAVKRASKQGGEIDYSLFTDGLRAEREQGITIDVAHRYFSTKKRKYIIADTPGHQQYTRNMATGASTADVGVILIDARLGVLTQSRRHAYIASLLGIPRLVVAINKMDLVNFSQEIFDKTVAAFTQFGSSLGFQEIVPVPISAMAGDNVVARSTKTPWYGGPTLMEYLERVDVGRSAASGALRFPVQLVLRPNLDYRGFAGQLASGQVCVGDEVVALPSGQRSRVRSIDTFEGTLQEASAPQSVVVRLDSEIDLSRGELLAHVARAPVSSTDLDATLVWMGDRPLDGTRELLLKHTSRRVRARIAQVNGKLDLETLELISTESLEKNDIAQVRLALQRPIFADAYRDLPATGAFILIDARSNETVAAGMIREARAGRDERAPVDVEERRRRFGHVGAVVQVGSVESAQDVERCLFDRGCLVARVTSTSAAEEVANAGLIAVVVSQGSTVPEGDVLSFLERTGVLEVL